MPPLHPTVLGRAAALAAVASLGLAGCSGAGDGAKASGCTTDGSNTLRSLADDRSALPADNWVPVVRATGEFRGRLVRLDQVTRSISAEEVTAVAVATGADRTGAIRAAVTDVPERSIGRPFRIAVAQGTTSEALAAVYEAALERLGSSTTVRATGAEDALEAVRKGKADVALVSLVGLTQAVGAEVPTDTEAAGQAEAVDAAARKEKLALGDLSETSRTAQVLVPDDVATQHDLDDISDLAAACADATIAATPGAEPVAARLADAYGLEISDEPATDPMAVLGQRGEVVAVVVATG